ncbi:MAG: asparagine synthase-related protein [Candidatus Nanopelagicales bacterium]
MDETGGGGPLAAWSRDGSGGPARLNGAFVGAQFEDGQLRLCRDQFGQVPLFWARIRGHILFSSVFKDFINVPGWPRGIDEKALGQLTVGATHSLRGRTAVEGVRRATVGATTEVSSTGHRVTGAWNPAAVQIEERWSFAQACDALDAAIRHAVADAVDPSVRTASHASGGIDSTLVSVLAHSSLKRRGGKGLVRLYSWTPTPEGIPEEESESTVVRRIGADLGIPVWFSPRIRMRSLDDWTRATEPMQDLGRERHVLQDALNEDVQILLSGWGGDDFASFGGRHYVENLLRRGQVRASSRQLRAEVRARGHSGLPFAARVLIGHGTRWWRAFGDGPVQATDGTDVDAARYEAALTHWKAASAREIMSWLVRSGHLEWRNEHWWEAGRRVGVEYRYPLLDMRVVETALAMPETYWARHGHKRAPIREVASRYVTPSWGVRWDKVDPELNAWRRTAG